MDGAPWWIQAPLLVLGLGTFVLFFWLSGKSWKADDAGVPKTRTLSVVRSVVVLAFIVAPTMRIFELDSGIWLWIGRTVSIACLVAFPMWVVAEKRRGTIRTRWDRDAPSQASPLQPSEVDRHSVDP